MLTLFNRSTQEFSIVSKQAKYNIPMKNIYFPLVYIHKVKRVNQNYIVDLILLDDFPLFVLAFSWVSSLPILNAIGIFCLMLSFWCIYEYGYYENDLVAEKYEQKPVLSHTYYKRLITIQWWQSWIWSLVIGLLGVYCIVVSDIVTLDISFSFPEITTSLVLRWNTIDESYRDFVNLFSKAFYKWFCFLLVSRCGFFVYNYVNKPTRIWLYPLLQSFRYCGILTVAATNIVGACIIMSYVLARSTTYIVYRYSGGNPNDWPKLQDWFLRLIFFCLFICAFSIVESKPSLIFNWQTVVLVGWWLKKCRRQAMEILQNIKPIWDEEVEDLAINDG